MSGNSETIKSDAKDWLKYDDFWIIKGRNMIENSIENLQNRIKNINAFLTYLGTGIFLGLSTYTTLIGSKVLLVYVLIALPLIAITWAKYVLGSKGGQIINSEIDMRSPTQINNEYNRIISQLSEQVKEVNIAASIATLITLVCLPIAIYIQNLNSTEKSEENYFIIQNDGNSKLIITANGIETEFLTATVYGNDKEKDSLIIINREIQLQNTKKFTTIFDAKKLKMKAIDSLEIVYNMEKHEVKSIHRFPDKTN